MNLPAERAGLPVLVPAWSLNKPLLVTLYLETLFLDVVFLTAFLDILFLDASCSGTTYATVFAMMSFDLQVGFENDGRAKVPRPQSQEGDPLCLVPQM